MTTLKAKELLLKQLSRRIKTIERVEIYLSKPWPKNVEWIMEVTLT